MGLTLDIVRTKKNVDIGQVKIALKEGRDVVFRHTPV